MAAFGSIKSGVGKVTPTKHAQLHADHGKTIPAAQRAILAQHGVSPDLLALVSGGGGMSGDPVMLLNRAAQIASPFRTPTSIGTMNSALSRMGSTLANLLNRRRPGAPQISTAGPARNFQHALLGMGAPQAGQPQGYGQDVDWLLQALGTPRMLTRWEAPFAHTPQLWGGESEAALGGLLGLGLSDQPLFQMAPGLWEGNMEALGALRGLAQGKDSLSEAQLRKATDRNIKQQAALMSAVPPSMQGMGARVAMQNMGAIGQDLAGQAAEAGIQERGQAWRDFSGLLGQTQGIDLGRQEAEVGARTGALGAAGGLASQLRGQEHGLSQANLAAMLQTMGLHQAQDVAELGAYMQGLGQMGDFLGGERSLEAQINQFNAQQQLQMRALQEQAARAAREGDFATAAANQQAVMQQRQLNDIFQMHLADLLMQRAQGMQAGAIAHEQARTARYTAPFGASPAPYHPNAAQRDTPLWQRILGGIGSALPIIGRLLSDEEKKENIEPGEKDVEEFLRALRAYKYDYKEPDEPGAGKGKHVSVMAQDLEKTTIGKMMVEDTPKGKMVNYGKGLAAMLAAQAHLHEKLEKLEGRHVRS